MRSTATNNTGTKKIASSVAATMPENTVTPIEMRDAAPAPLDRISGTTPRMKANEVMMIGRRRSLAASIAALTASLPASSFILANSTIRIAFLAARPISSTTPIWA